MIAYNSIDCLGYKVYSGNLSEIKLSDKIMINTINQYSCYVAELDADFKSALQESEILLPDGVGITMAASLIYKKKIKKIAGADVHDFLLKLLEKEGGRCFYLGSSTECLLKIENRIAEEYPNIKLAYFSPPFKDEFSAADNVEMLAEIAAFKPDVLFVGMTAPKQEKWALANKDLIDANIVCSIGAVFDFYAGTIKRSSDFWLKLKLEWLIRLVKEPRRMWKRYIYYGALFLIMVSKKWYQVNVLEKNA